MQKFQLTDFGHEGEKFVERGKVSRTIRRGLRRGNDIILKALVNIGRG